MECYTEDMIVKSKEVPDHIANLRERFEKLKEKNMRLNLSSALSG